MKQYAYTVYLSTDPAAADEVADIIEYVIEQGWAWDDRAPIEGVVVRGPRQVGDLTQTQTRKAQLGRRWMDG